jgi:hypothetical protein
VPRYIIERTVGTLTQEQLEAVGRKSNEVLDEMGNVRWIRSYISHAAGKIYCEYDAPSVDAIMEHARRTGIPADTVSEVSLEVSPAMFR